MNKLRQSRVNERLAEVWNAHKHLFGKFLNNIIVKKLSCFKLHTKPKPFLGLHVSVQHNHAYKKRKYWDRLQALQAFRSIHTQCLNKLNLGQCLT